jgi:hypothetical protein
MLQELKARCRYYIAYRTLSSTFNNTQVRLLAQPLLKLWQLLMEVHTPDNVGIAAAHPKISHTTHAAISYLMPYILRFHLPGCSRYDPQALASCLPSPEQGLSGHHNCWLATQAGFSWRTSGS